jgi:dolichol-phosphate mannosyltransferase
VDLRDAEAVESAVAQVKADWVFHLAAYGAYAVQQRALEMVATNVSGTINMLDSCSRAGCQAFVQAGSSSEYGYKDHPAEEGEVVQPNSAYAVTKAAATHYCQLVGRTRGLNTTTLRLYSIYGPYEEPTRLLPALMVHGLRRQLPPLVSAQTARDFTFVDDAVEAMLVAARAEGQPGAVYNVCTGRQSTLRDLVALVRQLMNISAEPQWATLDPRPWDTDVWVGSPRAIRETLGWQAACGLRDGLLKTIDWFMVNPRWRRFYEQELKLPAPSGASE